MRTRRTKDARQNNVAKRNLLTTKAVRKRIIEDSIKNHLLDLLGKG